MRKISHLVDGTWREYSFPRVYASPGASAERPYIVAGVPGDDASVFARLALLAEPPYSLLYVLHTPRGEGNPGRYQSPEISREELRAFLARFESFLTADARFDLWVHAPRQQAMVVRDRHDQLFAYGPLDRFAAELKVIGFMPGDPRVPVPHRHHFRAECDGEARALLAALPWTHSPLRPEDEQ